MSRIPRDIDDIMWVLAESNDVRAQEEFLQRYPSYRAELHKRVAMVSGIKSASKPSAPRDTNIPRFVPTPTVSYHQQPNRWVTVMLGVAIVVLAFASYKITADYVNRSEPVRYASEGTNNGVPDSNNHISPDLPKGIDQQSPPPKPIQELKPFEKPISIKIEKADMLSVIDMIARNAGIQVEIAPRMDNPQIMLEYHNVSGMRILDDLGKQFGFTVLREGGNKVLLVPAVDPARAQERSNPLGIAQVVEDDTPTPRK